MVKYIIKRILYAILILFFVSLLIYILVRLLPADYIDNKFAPQLAQGSMTQADIDAIKEKYGLLDNSFWGIISGYFTWLGNLVQLDLGMSFMFERPVAEVIGDYMWVSFGIALAAMVLQFLIAIPLGILSATHQYSPLDYGVSVFTMIGISLPSFFLANLLIKVFVYELGWIPSIGMVDPGASYTGLAYIGDVLLHCILPVATLVIINVGSLMRYSRTNTLEVLNADYVRTARAKGLSEHTVIYKHVFRNTMIPIVTMLAGTLPSLFGGAMITEQVFGLEGIGARAYQALRQGDIPFIMAYNMFLAVLTVIGTLLSDLAYAVVDPRVKLTK